MKKVIIVLFIIVTTALKILAQPAVKFIPWVIRISDTKATRAEADANYNAIISSIDVKHQCLKQYKDQIGIFQIKNGDLNFVGVLPSNQKANTGRYYKSILKLFYLDADDTQICSLTGYNYCKCVLTEPCWPDVD